MLNDREFAAACHISTDDVANMNDDVAAFAMWEFDLGAMKNSDGSLVFPELEGKPTPLYEIGYAKVDHAGILSENRRIARQAHSVRVAKYAEMVANNQPLFEGDDESAKDEWDEFFGGEHPCKQYKKCELID